MNDSTFTPVFLLFGTAIGILLGYLELLWLKRPLRLAGSWRALILLALVNMLFIFILLPAGNSYIFLFVFPIPIIPITYLVLTALAIFAIQRFNPSPLHAPWKLVFLSLFFNTAVSWAAYGVFAPINPSLENLRQAIRDKNNRRLDVMLWISVPLEPFMTILVNEALTDGNDDAVRRLIRRGPDPRQEYRIREGTRESQWRMTKWMLDQGLKPEEFNEMRQSPPFMDMALGQGVSELEYCLKKGFDPKKYPGVIGAAIDEHPLLLNHVLQANEVQALKDKIVLLLNHGADINGNDVSGFPAIVHLLYQNSDLSPVLTLFIEKGANINFQNLHPLYPENRPELPEGLTPLMLAVIEREPQYVPILVKSGADKTIRDSKGLSALDYARQGNADEATVRLLQ